MPEKSTTLQAMLSRALASGPRVTEPKVDTVVSAALRGIPTTDRAQGRSARRGPGKVVLFLDLDGCVHKSGDSRIDHDGQLVGAKLFRWLPHLMGVLNAHPDISVVVHSSWRKYWPTLPSLRELLPQALAARVDALTDPDILRRQESITAYLSQHPEVGAWVILDDQPWEFDDGQPLVVCNPQRGLSDRNVREQLAQALLDAKSHRRPRVGVLEGKLDVPEDFDAPLPPDVQTDFEGR